LQHSSADPKKIQGQTHYELTSLCSPERICP
jgi:hypothetical protein